MTAAKVEKQCNTLLEKEETKYDVLLETQIERFNRLHLSLFQWIKVEAAARKKTIADIWHELIDEYHEH